MLGQCFRAFTLYSKIRLKKVVQNGLIFNLILNNLGNCVKNKEMKITNSIVEGGTMKGHLRWNRNSNRTNCGTPMLNSCLKN